MECWMIKNQFGEILPYCVGRLRRVVVKKFVDECDWYVKPTWATLFKDGFRAVKVVVKERYPK